jgi:hypothetical protein
LQVVPAMHRRQYDAVGTFTAKVSLRSTVQGGGACI